MNLVLGIDASTKNIGWALMDYGTGQLYDSGVIRLSDRQDFYRRLRIGPRALKRALADRQVQEIKYVAIEHPFFTQNPNVIGKQISYMVGAVICIVLPLTEFVQEMTPGTWEYYFTGHKKPRADKKDKFTAKRPIVDEANRRYGLSLNVESDNDHADAIGIAAAFITMKKINYFENKRAEHKEVAKQRALKTAQKKAAKTGKPIEGELKL